MTEKTLKGKIALVTGGGHGTDLMDRTRAGKSLDD